MEAEAEGPNHACTAAKLGIVMALVFQNCAAVLFVRYTMTRGGERYHIPNVVFCQEFMKLVLSLAWLWLDARRRGALSNTVDGSASCASDDPSRAPVTVFVAGTERTSWAFMAKEVCQRDAFRMLVPSVLYTFQNVMLFYALKNLEATMFQVFYQSKMFVTALLMVVMLGRSFSTFKWICLCFLFLGIVLAQRQRGSGRGPEDGVFIIGFLSVLGPPPSAAVEW